MDFLGLREPVSACTHGAWMLLSIPATLWLWNRGGGERIRQLSLLVFGLGLGVCYSASALFHGAPNESGRVELFGIIDHVGIYILIAATYTPIACNLLSGTWRSGTLIVAWGFAVAGSALQLTWGTIPPLASTGTYLLMGWGAIFCYAEIARRLSHRVLRPMLVGGLFYSIGALLNLLDWPRPWPGVVGAHEVFHVLVMCGSLSHFYFMLTVVAPGPRLGEELLRPQWRPASLLPSRSGTRLDVPRSRLPRPALEAIRILRLRRTV